MILLYLDSVVYKSKEQLTHFKEDLERTRRDEYELEQRKNTENVPEVVKCKVMHHGL